MNLPLTVETSEPKETTSKPRLVLVDEFFREINEPRPLAHQTEQPTKEQIKNKILKVWKTIIDTTVADIWDQSEKGTLGLKRFEDIDPLALNAIKKIEYRTKIDKNGKITRQILNIQMVNKVRVLESMAYNLGMLQNGRLCRRCGTADIYY